ncbi:EamA family transporter [Rhizobium sp. CECT 9324]|jgi:O-acetylserine/cysteine efflux transporter|uniref:DMT family transporter n=1 Tax=Rhizobium sp. CECT 9324 TaxID=2845820 RepID=UPI0013AFD7C5|nr:EamA family transporter [Rhizobium sp. CECT 9324]CAH0340935.1 putative amino-acid metabolite efflux pump [Rhizobium sp. CECT 9324]
MRYRDFLVLMGVCLIWSLNVIIGKVMLSSYDIPPFYYAGIRFLGVAIVLSPLLRPIPQRIGQVALVGLLVGASHFGFLFLGLSAASPSSAAIVLQLGIPLTAMLSVIFLGERISSLRITGIALALAGVIAVMWNPEQMTASIGLVAIVISTSSLAVGGIFLKRLPPIAPLKLQAWVGLVSWVPLLLASWQLEAGQITTSLDGGYVFLAATLFSVLVVTVIAHTAYFGLLQRYEASMIAPLTLAMPIMTILLDVLLIGGHLSLRTIAGSTVALAGVLITLKAQPPARRDPVPSQT